MQLNTREDVGRDEGVGPYTGACGEGVIEPIEPVNLGDGASLDESLFAISPGVMVTQQPGIEVVWPNFTLESKEKEGETARRSLVELENALFGHVFVCFGKVAEVGRIAKDNASGEKETDAV